MLMIASPNKWSADAPQDVVCLPMPLKVHDLVGTLEMIVQAQARRKRSCASSRSREMRRSALLLIRPRHFSWSATA